MQEEHQDKENNNEEINQRIYQRNAEIIEIDASAGTIRSISKVHVNSARYASIDVFEINYRSIVVMKRKRDSYINASQILKAAQVEKKKRGRILKKLCRLSPFEKVEFGFHTFQGIWVPQLSAQRLAQRWDIGEQLLPLFEK